ncbi:MAG: phage holin family protein [Oscillospiraceae bacterium]|nr:phage holin family protein [Oscillospiraceae bacterium]
MKETILTLLGVVGAAIASVYGGWTTAMTTLLIFMAIDYISGIVVAAVFKNSPKSENGALESRAGWKGLIRKGMTLLIVLIAARIDVLLGTTYFRDATCIAFIVNETLSIVENAGLMGVPIPEVITKAIELLKRKEEQAE